MKFAISTKHPHVGKIETSDKLGVFHILMPFIRSRRETDWRFEGVDLMLKNERLYIDFYNVLEREERELICNELNRLAGEEP